MPDPIALLRHRAGSLCFALSGLVWGGFPTAWADEADHDRALKAVQRGEVLPLSALLDRSAELRGGHVLEVELESKQGRWVYEIKKLEPGGRLVKLKVDARTGELLHRRERPPPDRVEPPSGGRP